MGVLFQPLPLLTTPSAVLHLGAQRRKNWCAASRRRCVGSAAVARARRGAARSVRVLPCSSNHATTSPGQRLPGVSETPHHRPAASNRAPSTRDLLVHARMNACDSMSTISAPLDLAVPLPLRRRRHHAIDAHEAHTWATRLARLPPPLPAPPPVPARFHHARTPSAAPCLSTTSSIRGKVLRLHQPLPHNPPAPRALAAPLPAPHALLPAAARTIRSCPIPVCITVTAQGPSTRQAGSPSSPSAPPVLPPTRSAASTTARRSICIGHSTTTCPAVPAGPGNHDVVGRRPVHVPSVACGVAAVPTPPATHPPRPAIVCGFFPLPEATSATLHPPTRQG